MAVTSEIEQYLSGGSESLVHAGKFPPLSAFPRGEQDFASRVERAIMDIHTFHCAVLADQDRLAKLIEVTREQISTGKALVCIASYAEREARSDLPSQGTA